MQLRRSEFGYPVLCYVETLGLIAYVSIIGVFLSSASDSVAYIVNDGQVDRSGLELSYDETLTLVSDFEDVFSEWFLPGGGENIIIQKSAEEDVPSLPDGGILVFSE